MGCLLERSDCFVVYATFPQVQAVAAEAVFEQALHFLGSTDEPPDLRQLPLGQTAPLRRWRHPVLQAGEQLRNFTDRETRLLGDMDPRQPPQNSRVIPALAADPTFGGCQQAGCLVEADG
jgi:hypothetical protein